MDQVPIILKALFGSVPCLRGLPMGVVEDVALSISEVAVPGGEFLFNEGDIGDALYLVHQGRVRILKDAPDGSLFVVAEIGRGGVIGEMALLSDMPRSAHALAIRDTVLWRLDKEPFFDLVNRYPALMVCVARTIVDRAVGAISGKGHVASLATIAVVNLLPDSRRPALIRQLMTGFERLNAASLVSSDSDWVRQCLSRDSDQEARRCIGARLHELESAGGYLVLECNATFDEWLRTSLRQADKVLVCCDVEQPPDDLTRLLDEIRDATANVSKPVEAIIVHPPDVAVARTSSRAAALFHGYPLHNIRWQNHDDLARVTRIVTDQGSAVVLGGGGARGMAHFGVLKAFEESNVAVDLVGGTSIGAIIGACYAHGWSFDEMMFRFREQVRSRWSLLDFSLPRYSLFRGRKLDRILERAFGDTCAEDLWRGFFCVSTDYETARQRVHSRGRLAELVRASISLPGIFPLARSDGGEHLMDGGVVNNLPADVMRQHTPNGKVIAVDVGTGDSGVKGVNRAPSILETMTRTAIMTSQRRQERMITSGIIDLVIRPDVGGFGLMDFRAMDALVERGYEAGMQAISDGALADLRNPVV